MLISVSEERLLVVSDVHLGNGMFRSRRPFVEFLNFAAQNGYNLCINGDGVDIIQTSIRQVSRDLGECAASLRKFRHRDLRVYYVVGNHDIVLENFLDDWEVLHVVPFLNVTSGTQRIRIEHGHIYDPAFVKYPGVYTVAMVIGGIALRIHPQVYRACDKFKDVLRRVFRLESHSVSDDVELGERIPGEPPAFQQSAEEIAKHGFDYVLFGHTHCRGRVRLGSGAEYLNTGSWLFEPYYVEIDRGEVTMKPVADVIAQRSAVRRRSEPQRGTAASRRSSQA